MAIEYRNSKKGAGSYQTILATIRKHQKVNPATGNTILASLKDVANELGTDVDSTRQALQRYRRKFPDYVRTEKGHIVIGDEELHWNAGADPIEYGFEPVKKEAEKKAPSKVKK